MTRKRLRRSEDFAESYLESLDTSTLDGIPTFNFDFDDEGEQQYQQQQRKLEPKYELENELGTEPEIESVSADPTPDPTSSSPDLESESADLELEPEPSEEKNESVQFKPRKSKRIISVTPLETRTHKVLIPRLIKADNSKQPTITIAFNQKRPVQLPPNKLDMDALWLAHWQQFEQNRTRL